MGQQRQCSHVGLHERVGDGFHAVHGADESDGGAAADHEPQLPRVRGEAVRVVRVPQVLDAVVQHDVQQRVIALQNTAALPPPGELYPDLLVDEPAQVQDRFLLD